MATEEESNREWWRVTLENAPPAALFAELKRRGFGQWQATSKAQSERNDAPVQRWLEVWRQLYEVQDYHTNIALHAAIRELYLLLEPPSVRQERLKEDAVLEFVEGDE